MFVVEFINLQFHEYVAFQDAVVKDQIHKAARVADDDALLLRLKAEAVTELEKEFAQILHQRRLQIGLRHGVLGPQSEELEDVGIADYERRFRRLHAFLHHL